MARLCYISRGRCSAECNVALTKDEAAGPPARSHRPRKHVAAQTSKGQSLDIFESKLSTSRLTGSDSVTDHFCATSLRDVWTMDWGGCGGGCRKPIQLLGSPANCLGNCADCTRKPSAAVAIGTRQASARRVPNKFRRPRPQRPGVALSAAAPELRGPSAPQRPQMLPQYQLGPSGYLTPPTGPRRLGFCVSGRVGGAWRKTRAMQ